MTPRFVYVPPFAVGVSLPSAQQTLREQMNLRMRSARVPRARKRTKQGLKAKVLWRELHDFMQSISMDFCF